MIASRSDCIRPTNHPLEAAKRPIPDSGLQFSCASVTLEEKKIREVGPPPWKKRIKGNYWMDPARCNELMRDVFTDVFQPAGKNGVQQDILTWGRKIIVLLC